MARTRQVVAVLTVLTLIVIAIGVTGVDLPLPRVGGSSSAQAPQFQGVRAVSSATFARIGAGAPPGGELAFMAVEPSGTLFVSDSGRDSVLRFDPSGQLLTEWGPNLGGMQLTQPAGVAVAGGNYYVMDRGTPRIFRLDASGQVLAVLSLESLSTYGLNGLGVDPAGNLYAADTGRNRILVFSPSGQLLKQVGHSGSDLGGFTQPMMLAFGPDGGFFVADWENNRVERFNPSPAFDASDAWPVGFHAFGVAVDPSGRVYVPDSEHRRVEVFTPSGQTLGELGEAGPQIGLSPRQVAIGGPATLYVLGSDGIQRLDLANTAPPPVASGSLDADVVSLLAIVLMLALVVVAIVARRQRRLASVGAAFEGPVRLDAKNGAHGQDQQAKADEELLIAHQSKGE